MSAFNYHLSPPKVLIASDTLGYGPDSRPTCFTSKFFPVPHLNLVVVQRGADVEAFELQARLLELLLPNGIDSLNEIASNLCNAVHNDFLIEYGTALEADQRKCEFLAFGWSECESRVVGYIYSSDNGFDPVRAPDGTYFWPQPEAVEELSDKDKKALRKFKSPETFIVASRLQQKTILRDYGYGMGGDLLLLELGRNGMSTKKIYRFADYQESLEAMPGYEPDNKQKNDGQGAPRPCRPLSAKELVQ